jgi:hypothetical protein
VQVEATQYLGGEVIRVVFGFIAVSMTVSSHGVLHLPRSLVSAGRGDKSVDVIEARAGRGKLVISTTLLLRSGYELRVA